MARRLRSGYTTGACAAAATKAATLAYCTGDCPDSVEITFPDGSLHHFAIHSCTLDPATGATAAVIKDAGDDPDVTNRAHICAQVTALTAGMIDADCVSLGSHQLCRGLGVGLVTKPGLAVPPKEPAINPVPRQMIGRALEDVAPDRALRVTIFIPDGEQLAEKTLNHRLGIVGGLSILGSTGIVRPISADAWTATIKASLDVAVQAGLRDIVFSTGRTSEKGVQGLLNLPEEAYAMMGDYLEFSMLEAKKRPFATIHFAAMWAKLVKAALRIPQTHVRNGALEVQKAAELLADLGAPQDLVAAFRRANTAREIFLLLERDHREDLLIAVCRRAQAYCNELTGRPVSIYLVNHKAEIVCHV